MSGQVADVRLGDVSASLPQAQRIAVRMASFGILAVLLALVACGAWGIASTYRTDVAVKRATEASNAIEQVRKGIAAERLIRRSAGGTPGEDARARHKEASASIQSNLQAAHVFTEGVDRRLVDDLVTRHGQYLAASGAAWGDTPDDAVPTQVFDPSRSDTARIDAALSTLEADTDQVAERLRVQALALVQLVVDVQMRVLLAGPLLFGLGLLLVGAIWRMQRSEQRRGTTRLVADAYAANWQERRFRGVVDSAPEPMLICAGPGTMLYHNTATEEVWSYQPADLDGQSILQLAHPEDRAALRVWWEQLTPAARARPGAATKRIALRLRNGAGAWLPAELVGTNLLDDPNIHGVVLTIRNPPAMASAAEAQVNEALFDPLTRLPNPALLRDRLGRALSRAGGRMEPVALLIVGLDGLPPEPARDLAVLEASTRIQSCVRPQDTVARLDATRFVVVRELSAEDTDAVALAEALAGQFSRPLAGGAADILLQPRIGVVLGDPRQDTVDSLLRNAGLALQQVTPDAVARHAMFQTGARSETLDRVELEGDLRGLVRRMMATANQPGETAGAGRELQVHYQPIVRLPSRGICGFEALLRWQHPLHGLVPLRDLIPMSEETGLIVPLGQWVLEEACRQVAAWQGSFRAQPPLTLGVNLSSQQFRRPELVADVTHALAASGLQPGCLRLELTEATIMRDADHAVRTLWKLKELGVQLAIDDFGSGYSALPYLKQLPIGLLKIDSAFVAGIGRNQEDTSIVRAVMSLAKSLGWGVTAEGIETASQAARLIEWGCDFGQGYYFGRPIDGSDAATILARGRPLGAAVDAPLAPA